MWQEKDKTRAIQILKKEIISNLSEGRGKVNEDFLEEIPRKLNEQDLRQVVGQGSGASGSVRMNVLLILYDRAFEILNKSPKV